MSEIEFASAQFLPYLPEDAQINPGAYDFELAQWLSQALSRCGIVTSYPVSEDWGWFLEYDAGEAEFVIGCAAWPNPATAIPASRSSGARSSASICR